MAEISRSKSNIDKNKVRRMEFETMMESTLSIFQHKMHELTRLIENWTSDTDICITTSDTYLTINLPFINSYPLPSITFEYAGRIAKIVPKYIFIAGGAKGVIHFTYNPPSLKSFTIFMEVPHRENDGWIICREGETSIDGRVLTEKEFFRALQN
ncbi:hypothetical protein [Buttiauxella sp. 3AFRM03]|uniref:hypothetical protein n=1 Tax=Buttiauxella sp. 3AFRM03 TaxID=2479367 RepID=UPI0013903070|nr:hypothetical protein [Buttiauxella sp. 3AFRM03]